MTMTTIDVNKVVFFSSLIWFLFYKTTKSRLKGNRSSPVCVHACTCMCAPVWRKNPSAKSLGSLPPSSSS